MEWRKKYAHKLRTAPEAVSGVLSGQSVTIAMYDGVPASLCNALAARAPELEDVTVFHFVANFPWYKYNQGREAGRPPAFRHLTPFATNVDRDAIRDGGVEYLPVGIWRSGRIPPGAGPFDYHFCTISPPDAEGWCSFGSSVWMNPTFADNSDVIIAEVDESAIRTGGQNRIHVDRIDTLVEQDARIREKIRGGMRRAQERNDEETAAAEVICTLVAMELVRDGDTVQVGTGAVSAALSPYLTHRRDLGIHTELLPGGVVDLVEAGVVTGARKGTHPGKVVATGLALMPDEEVAYIDGNSTFELHDFTYTDDIDVLCREPRLVAVNNAMQVDLTGQVNGETVGPWPYTGPGGQTAFAISAHHSEEGRSVIVLPSSYRRGRELRSRIVASLDPGAPVTAPRSAVDYVVTEHGIATLRGKSIGQRIGELIAIAPPDWRPQLREEAARLFGREV